MTRDQQVQQVARALSEDVVRVCTHCGQPEATDTAGRRRHEQLHGHRLSGTETSKEGC